jgi:hypothetical protein
MQVTLVQHSPRLMGEKLRQNQVFLNGINGPKRVPRTWKMMKTMLITFFDTLFIVNFEFIPQGLLCGNTEAVM